MRIDVNRTRLLRGEPALRVHVDGGVRFGFRVEFPGGRVIQDGTAAWVEVDVPATVDGIAVSGDAAKDAGS